MSGREERERAVELYFSTPMSTKQVVEHLGYPTRQCPGTVAARRSQVCGCRPGAADVFLETITQPHADSRLKPLRQQARPHLRRTSATA